MRMMRAAPAVVLQGARPSSTEDRVIARNKAHDAAMHSPASGKYMYRSAVTWLPVRVSCSAGESVARNQPQPTSRYGRGRAFQRAAAVIRTTSEKQPIIEPIECEPTGLG
jgi:hypothetical protein